MKTVIHYRASRYPILTENWIGNTVRLFERYQPIIYAHSRGVECPGQNEIVRTLKFDDGIKIPEVFFNKAWKQIFHFYPSFFMYVLRDKPSMIHAHFGTSGYEILTLKKIFRLPLLTTFYGFDLSMLPRTRPEWKRRYIKLFRHGEMFMVEGNYMKKSLEAMGCPAEKIIVHHIGVDIDRIDYRPRDLAQDNVKIFMAGRFVEKKGFPIAVEAVSRIMKNYKNVRLVIAGDSAGSDPEEEQKNKVITIIRENNIIDQVELLGFVTYETMISNLYNADIFLSPSIEASDGDNEGGAPVSLIEASASGIPVVSTYHCDIPEVILDELSGYLVREHDIEGIVDKLMLLILNPSLRREMGESGRKHIVENYNLKKQASALEKIYDEIIAGGNDSHSIVRMYTHGN